VIDPTKVTRTALQNAASIASLMLTTEAMICGVVEEVDDQLLVGQHAVDPKEFWLCCAQRGES